jgi:hypothetical protein
MLTRKWEVAGWWAIPVQFWVGRQPICGVALQANELAKVASSGTSLTRFSWPFVKRVYYSTSGGDVGTRRPKFTRTFPNASAKTPDFGVVDQVRSLAWRATETTAVPI